MGIWQELKRRKVLRVAAAYIVIAWILMQVAATLEGTLELPGWFDKVTFAALLLGFPLALLLSWAYDVHPDSSLPTSPSTPGKSLFIAALVALVLVGSSYSYYLFRGQTSAAGAQAITPTIAVLPFTDLSPGGDQAWFADGVSEELLNVLAKTEGLKVASRTASFRFRGDDVDIKTVAAELNVATILEGSVRSQGDQLRITAQLINAEDGFHLWSDTYDRQLNDIFAVQDEISVNIATALFGELGIEALPERRFDGTRNIEAYTLYLQGMEKVNKGDGLKRSNMRSAVPDLKRSIELDPEFSDAWVGLARAENVISIWGALPPAVSPSLQRALVLDPENADAIAELAWANEMLLNWPEAEQLYLRAISIQPDNARIHRLYGDFLRVSGRIQPALDEFLKAWELGSTFPSLASLIVSTYAYLGRFADVRAFFEARIDEVGMENATGNEAYFVSLLADGMEAQAREFGTQNSFGRLASGRIRFFLDRLDGDPMAGERLIEATFERIASTNSKIVRSGDLENMVLAGEIQLAREYAPKVWGSSWGVPPRYSLYVDDEVDPRYLPYRGNLLLIADQFPDAPEAFNAIGVDILALAREKGYVDLPAN